MKKHTFNKVYGYWEAVLSFCWRQQPGKSGEVCEKRGKHRISHSRQVQPAEPIELGGLCLAWTPQLSPRPCWHCFPSFIFHFRLLHVLLLPWDSQTPWEVRSSQLSLPFPLSLPCPRCFGTSFAKFLLPLTPPRSSPGSRHAKPEVEAMHQEIHTARQPP